MLRVFIFILALFSGFSSLSARETMNQKYEKAAIIGREAIGARNVETRTELIQSIKQKYSFVPYVWSLIPTYDITIKYKPYIQRYKLSCEIAATKMVMESLGTHTTEDDILYRIPTFSGSLGESGIWGNPEKEFVGDIRGSQYNKTGYGIYEAPLASYLNERGFDAKIMNASTYQKGMSANKHLMTLLEQITKGSRVILWGDYCTTPSLEDGILADNSYKTLMKFFPIAAKNHCDRKSDDRTFSWKTPEGTEAKGISGEHAFLLLGYIGNINHPTHIIVWDTSTGRHVFQYDEWMRKWSLLQFRSLIVNK